MPGRGRTVPPQEIDPMPVTRRRLALTVAGLSGLVAAEARAQPDDRFERERREREERERAERIERERAEERRRRQEEERRRERRE